MNEGIDQRAASHTCPAGAAVTPPRKALRERLVTPFDWIRDVWRHREIYWALLGAEAWVIAITVFITLVLAAPAQVIELYRIIYADRPGVDVAWLLLWLSIMSLAIWASASLILAMALGRIESIHVIFSQAHMLPVGLASLPFIGCGIGHLFALPRHLDKKTIDANVVVGSPWVQTSEMLKGALDNRLYLFGGLFLVIGAVLLAVSFGAQRLTYSNRFVRLATSLDRITGMVVVFAGILFLDLLFVLAPVALPRALGAFGIISLFVAAVAINCALLTLLSYRFRLPLVPVFLILAVVWSLRDWNDNHALRIIPSNAAGAPDTAANQFEKWYRARPDLADYPDGYPVFVVSAQGGGIYAAYQAAITLARLQDRCPEFRDHLFAISSVSGGSIGAASFVATLPQTPLARDNAPRGLRCKNLLDNTIALPGRQEVRLNKALLEDHLSPLAAGALFPDFTQRFLPLPIDAFDRSRALEYSFENSLEGEDGKSPLAASFRGLWNPAKSVPALVLNTTDAGSGLRYIFSPFSIPPQNAWTKKSVNLYPLWSKDRDVRLSTAAVSSARFPWLTPAGLVPGLTPEQAKADGDDDGRRDVRIVDGGYVDNSGIETALEVMAAMKGPVGLPPLKPMLIAITTSEVPKRTSYALGETLEPVRALMSTRSSRSYLALGRAYIDRVGDEPFAGLGNKQTPMVTLSPVQPISLSNQYYELPLGWRLSRRTAEIIALQSGRAWDCMPNTRMLQSRAIVSSADCVQSVIAAQMSGTLPEVMRKASIANFRPTWLPKDDSPRIARQALLRCIDDERARRNRPRYTYAQADAANAMLRAWDLAPELTDPNLLAFMLAIVENNTSDNLPVSQAGSVEGLSARYAAATRAGKVIGNIMPGDGAAYRGRGFLYLSGRENYERVGKALKVDLANNPEMINNLDVSAASVIWWMTKWKGRQISAALNQSPPDWRQAWLIMNKDEIDGHKVKPIERVRAYLPCVQKTLASPPQRRAR